MQRTYFWQASSLGHSPFHNQQPTHHGPAWCCYMPAQHKHRCGKTGMKSDLHRWQLTLAQLMQQQPSEHSRPLEGCPHNPCHQQNCKQDCNGIAQPARRPFCARKFRNWSSKIWEIEFILREWWGWKTLECPRDILWNKNYLFLTPILSTT